MTKRFALLVASISIGFVAVVSVAYSISANSQPKAAYTAPSTPTKAQLLKLVNAERAKNGVSPLTEDAMLDKSAQWKADDEVTYHYFGHVRPGTTGNDGLDYLSTLPIGCKYISENLTENLAGRNTSEQAASSWINSPAHHAAMIDSKYSLTGFGINGNQVVEHFCQQ